MKIGIITDQVHEDFETALQMIKEQGYSYVEIHNVFGKSIEECTLEEGRKIKVLLDQYGMTCSDLATTVFFLCPLYKEDEVSLFNESFFSIKGNVHMHLAYLENACKLANIIGCNLIRSFPFRFPDNRKGPYGTKEHQALIEENLRLASEIVEKYNCTLIVENCPYSHLPKGEMTGNIVKNLNKDSIRLLWDPANSYRAVKENVPEEYLHLSLLEELKNMYSYISHIHIKDYHYDSRYKKPFLHTAIYDGDINFDELFTYLEEQGYNGVLSLEPEVDEENTILCMERLNNKIKSVEN